MIMDEQERELLADAIGAYIPQRMTPEEIRDQRRYEIARDIFVRYEGSTPASSIKAAEDFLAELERTK